MALPNSQFYLHWLILITPFYVEKYSVELRSCHKVINICKMWNEHKQMCLLLAVTKKKESYYFRSYNSRLKTWQLCSLVSYTTWIPIKKKKAHAFKWLCPHSSIFWRDWNLQLMKSKQPIICSTYCFIFKEWIRDCT